MKASIATYASDIYPTKQFEILSLLHIHALILCGVTYYGIEPSLQLEYKVTLTSSAEEIRWCWVPSISELHSDWFIFRSHRYDLDFGAQNSL